VDVGSPVVGSLVDVALTGDPGPLVDVALTEDPGPLVDVALTEDPGPLVDVSPSVCATVAEAMSLSSPTQATGSSPSDRRNPR